METLALLQSKDNAAAYQALLRLEQESAQSDVHYASFDAFLTLLHSPSSFARTRGFRLACAQAPWDSEGKLARHLDTLLALLDDDRPTTVRQCLAALGPVVLRRPELIPRIEEKLDRMNLARYRDSMRLLIERDVAALRNLMD